MYIHVLLCTSRTSTHYHVLRCTFTWCRVFWCPSMYFRSLPRISMYSHILPYNSVHFYALQHTPIYFHVLPYTSMYFRLFPKYLQTYIRLLPLAVYPRRHYVFIIFRRSSFIAPKRATSLPVPFNWNGILRSVVRSFTPSPTGKLDVCRCCRIAGSRQTAQ